MHEAKAAVTTAGIVTVWHCYYFSYVSYWYGSKRETTVQQGASVIPGVADSLLATSEVN